jgi:signal transduction histidine kinase
MNAFEDDFKGVYPTDDSILVDIYNALEQRVDIGIDGYAWAYGVACGVDMVHPVDEDATCTLVFKIQDLELV